MKMSFHCEFYLFIKKNNKMFRTLLLVLIIAQCLLQSAEAQTILSDSDKSNIQSRIDNNINTGIVIGFIDAEGHQFFKFGVKSLTSKEPVDEHSIFEIGSISKTFTGLLLAEMALKKELNLDDPLQNYLPEGVTAPTRNGQTIKLFQMSNHTSSLPRMPNNFAPADPANPYLDYSEKQLYDFLNSCELTRDIGSQYEYSNYAVGLLGHILASKKKMSYEELMVELITKPLNLQNTTITLTQGMKNNLAIGHSGGKEVKNWDFVTLAGAGAIRSSAFDMLKYVAANMGKRKSELYPAMQLAHKNSRDEGESPIVGLGWHTMTFDKKEIVWHNGGTGGYRSFAGFVKGGKTGVVVLTNSDASADDIGIHILHNESPLKIVKPSIATKLKEIIAKEGLEAGLASYHTLKSEQGEIFNYEVNQLNSLGYSFLNDNEIDKAIAIFELNIEAFPMSSNVYDSYAEAQMKKGDKDLAISNYKKSVELNPGNQNALDKLKELGVSTKDLIKEIIIDTKVLDKYLGKYELAPGFIISVSREDNQLKAQATGQGEFLLFPTSETEFYLKVVEARVIFTQNEKGTTESLTLFQGGQEIVGKRIIE